MKTALLAAAFAASLGLATMSAFAAPAPANPWLDTGSAQLPAYAGAPLFNGFNTVTLLPTNGSEGAIQTANSLPSAPEIGGNEAGQVAGLNPAFGPAARTSAYAAR